MADDGLAGEGDNVTGIENVQSFSGLVARRPARPAGDTLSGHAPASAA